MHFYNLLEELSKSSKIVLFVDMDGVISSYDFGKPLDFVNKRPLSSNINNLEKICSLDNIEIHILSICREDKQIEEKINWLLKYVPFIVKENIHILSKHGDMNNSSSKMKLEFLQKYKTDKQIALIDDDIRVLKLIYENFGNILLFQDSELVD